STAQTRYFSGAMSPAPAAPPELCVPFPPPPFPPVKGSIWRNSAPVPLPHHRDLHDERIFADLGPAFRLGSRHMTGQPGESRKSSRLTKQRRPSTSTSRYSATRMLPSVPQT